MKKILITVFLLSISSFVKSEVRPYIEGSVGYYKMNTTNEGNFKYDPSGNPLTSYNIKTGGDGVTNVGIELGLAKLFNTGFRVSISETYLKLTNLKTNGYLTSNAGTTLENNVPAGNANVNLMMFNGYYDLNIENSSFLPYVGAGVGSYANNRMTGTASAWSLMTGVNYALTTDVYLGLKGTYYFLGGATVGDGSGNTFNSTNSYSVNGTIGYKF